MFQSENELSCIVMYQYLQVYTHKHTHLLRHITAKYVAKA